MRTPPHLCSVQSEELSGFKRNLKKKKKKKKKKKIYKKTSKPE